MADQHKSDIVMKFVTLEGDPVFAECALDRDKSDAFMNDFNPATYQDYSDFFEVSKFNFGFEVHDEDKSKNTLSADKMSSKVATKAQFSRVVGEFASWRSADDTQAPEIIFPVEPEPFRFERLIDAASPVFFKHCCDSKSFASAALVKRVAAGNAALPVGFLRIDFQNVLVTSLSWDDGDMTTEKCEFICRDFKVQYRQQRANGSFGPKSQASWNYKRDALPEK